MQIHGNSPAEADAKDFDNGDRNQWN